MKRPISYLTRIYGLGMLLALLFACSLTTPPMPTPTATMSPTVSPPTTLPPKLPVPTVSPTLALPRTATPEPPAPLRVVGYVADWGVTVAPQQIEKLTHLNYAFALPKADGTLDFPANTWKLQQYVRDAHERGVRVLISVGGWGYDKQFEAFAASPELRAVFVKNLMQYVDENNLDGVDVDWEYPTAGASAENFFALMKELRVELDARKNLVPRISAGLLTAAVAAYGEHADGIPDASFALVDFLNIMAYADSGAHHSTYALAKQSLDYWRARGLPQNKMVLGVPFYAQPGDVSYRKLVQSDANAAQSDFANYLGGVAAYNGLPTMRAKTQLAKARANGVMIWTINDDALGEHSLLNAIQETLQGKHTELPPLPFGAGLRYSTYGPPYEPGAKYWADFAEKMAERFDGARPQIIWIVGNVSGTGTQLTFFGKSANPAIHFSMKDRNEEALALFDKMGAQVWLQVEPGNAPVDELIRLVLEKYAQHPSVIGVGVDVEWFKSTDKPAGQAVSDADARLWRDTARQFNPTYRLFLKHWEKEKMPPTEREGIVFVDDSQKFASLDAMVNEFETWGKTFAPAQVGFQFGYPADKKWWGELEDAPKEIGNALRARVPNIAGLYWVDFSAFDVFKPNQ